MKHNLNDFLHYIRYIEPKAKLTVESYRNDLEQYLDFLEKNNVENLKKVKFSDINYYLQSLKNDYALSSIQHKAVSIRQFHQYLLQMGIVNSDPSQYLDVKNMEDKLPHIVSVDSIDSLLSFNLEKDKDYLDKTILLLLYHSGLRVSELCALRFSHLYLDERWIRIMGKGSKERMVPISFESQKALKHYLNTIRPRWDLHHSDFVFINKKGMTISRQYIHTMIKYRSKEMGVTENISAHSLRHRFATSFLEAGVDLRYIQELLGHSDIATTQIYTHVNVKTMRSEYDQFVSGSSIANKKGGNDDE